jgi:hypothetical protein
VRFDQDHQIAQLHVNIGSTCAMRKELTSGHVGTQTVDLDD